MDRGKPRRAEAERVEGARGGTLSRRSVLGGLAILPAIPVLCSIESVAPAAATPALTNRALGTATKPPASAPTATDELVRGVERRYNAPLLTSGTRLVLPANVKAVAVEDYYRRPHLASAKSTWPHMTAADGSTVDASVVPERGAPTRIAMLSGFTEGWYELIHASGRADRVAWDGRKLPYLFVHGEFGGTDQEPFRQLYTLALQPMSRNPYPRSTPIL